MLENQAKDFIDDFYPETKSEVITEAVNDIESNLEATLFGFRLNQATKNPIKVSQNTGESFIVSAPGIRPTVITLATARDLDGSWSEDPVGWVFEDSRMAAAFLNELANEYSPEDDPEFEYLKASIRHWQSLYPDLKFDAILGNLGSPVEENPGTQSSSDVLTLEHNPDMSSLMIQEAFVDGVLFVMWFFGDGTSIGRCFVSTETDSPTPVQILKTIAAADSEVAPRFSFSGPDFESTFTAIDIAGYTPKRNWSWAK